jgi:putative ABC transport system substrate-binding protein
MTMQRREFITLLGGAAAAWPLAARAQQNGRVRRVGVLLPHAERDPEAQARVTAFRQVLQGLGWIDNRNIRIDYRFAAGVTDRVRVYAAELIGLAPDVILADSSLVLSVLQQTTHNVPTVFVQVGEPVEQGFVPSQARPGGNITGFTSIEYSMAGKWLELLKEIAPGIARVAVLYADAPSASPFLRTVEPLAPLIGVQLTQAAVQDSNDIERSINAFAREPNGGLLVLTSPFITVHRDLIIMLAAKHRLPSVHGFRFFATSGGLMSYGADPLDLYRRAASYVDRILRGEKPADLPVQFPVKFELVVNLKTAKAIGLTIPEAFLLRADELIE